MSWLFSFIFLVIRFTYPLYALLCSFSKSIIIFCSILSGNSVITSFLVLLNINGFIRFLSSIIFLSLFINILLNFDLLYKYPGIIKSNIDQSSIKLFSIGVPVNANLTLAFTFFIAFVIIASGFLMFWASSIIQ